MIFPLGVVCQSPMICCELSATHHISSRCRSVAHQSGVAQCRQPYLDGDHFNCSEGRSVANTFKIVLNAIARATVDAFLTRWTVYHVPRYYAWRLLHYAQPRTANFLIKVTLTEQDHCPTNRSNSCIQQGLSHMRMSHRLELHQNTG